MRILMYLTIGFAATCGLYGYPITIRLLGCVVVLTICFFVQKGRGAAWRILLPFLGVLLASLWIPRYHQHYLEPVAAMDGKVLHCTIRASDYSRETDYGVAFDGILKNVGKTYRVTTYLDDRKPFAPGEGVTGYFRLRVTTDTGENPSSYHTGKGVFLLAYQDDAVTRFQMPETHEDIPAKLRHHISGILETCVPTDCVPFAKALLLGDTSELSYQTDTNLKISGIRHVVAVSGLHISILFAILCMVTFRKRILTACVGIPLLFLFAAIAGFTPSVSRACIMASLMLLAQLVNREYDGPTALSFAVLVMLLANPYAIRAVGFQLSVASVSGIFLFTPWIRAHLVSRIEGKKGKWFTMLRRGASAVSVTLSAQILTIPISAYYFGVVSLIGVLTNLLVLWVVSFLFCLLIVLCVVSVVSVPLASIFGAVAGMLIRYVLLVAKWMASFPLAAIYTVSPYVTIWLLFAYLLGFLFFLCGKQQHKSFACCGILCLCLALIASWCEACTSDATFTVLDVGQGQCLLLQSHGKTYVVDCGGDSDRRAADIAAEELLSRGFSKVDGLILTHTDRDHAGAAENFLSRIPTDFLILPLGEVSFSVPERTKIVYAERDLEITDGNTKISIYAPVFYGSGNQMSLCVLFETQNCDILITGDRDGFGERSLLRHTPLPDVDILVAGHHGSRYSTTEELLQAVTPEIVCISAGAENRYGHPAPELLKRLSDFGCTVYRTDRQGTILIRR